MNAMYANHDSDAASGRVLSAEHQWIMESAGSRPWLQRAQGQSLYDCIIMPEHACPPTLLANDTVLRPAGKLADIAGVGSVRICCIEGPHSALDDGTGTW